jgi:hypothetical protein
MRVRLITFLLVLVGALFAAAPALASPGGEGWYGPSSDSQITSTMFLVIIFFPAVIIVFSLIQWALDRRKHARMDAAKRRAASADWRGGW